LFVVGEGEGRGELEEGGWREEEGEEGARRVGVVVPL